MIRTSLWMSLVIALAVAMPSFSLGQVGGPPRPNQNPQRPPGPSAEDILRLFIPPEDQYYDDGEYEPQYNQRGSNTPQRATQQLHIPTAAEVSRMSAQQQRANLRQSLARLDADLDKQSTGAAWKEHLQLGELGSTLWCRPESEPEPDADTRDVLKAIAKKFDEVQQNPKYRVIHALPGFQLTRAVLPEYATGAVEKSQQSLQLSTLQLAESLGRINGGPTWKQFLQIDELQRRAQQTERLQPDDTKVLQLIGEKFDEVEKDPKYRRVASSAGFASSRSHLQQMVAALKKEQTLEAQRAASAPPVLVNRAHLERMVVGMMAELKDLRRHCAEESEAQLALDAAKFAAQQAGPGDILTLVKKANNANDVLRAIQERHEQAEREADAKLLAMLKAIRASSTANDGKVLTLLPQDSTRPNTTVLELVQSSERSKKKDAGDDIVLMQFKDQGKPENSEDEIILMQFKNQDKPTNPDGAARILPLGTDPPKKPEATILPLGTDPPNEPKSSTKPSDEQPEKKSDEDQKDKP